MWLRPFCKAASHTPNSQEGCYLCEYGLPAMETQGTARSEKNTAFPESSPD